MRTASQEADTLQKRRIDMEFCEAKQVIFSTKGAALARYKQNRSKIFVLSVAS
jgi:hypothetical protein